MLYDRLQLLPPVRVGGEVSVQVAFFFPLQKFLKGRVDSFFGGEERNIYRVDAVGSGQEKADGYYGVPAGADFEAGVGQACVPCVPLVGVEVRARMAQPIAEIGIVQVHPFGDVLLKEIIDLLAPGQVGDRFLDDGFKHPFLHACGLIGETWEMSGVFSLLTDLSQ